MRSPSLSFLISVRNSLSLIAKHPLTRSKPLSTFRRLVRWQIGARLLGYDSIIPWVDGSLLSIRAGETGLTGNIYFGLIEYKEMCFILHALPDDVVFVDVGANAGAYTVLASKVVGVHTVAFEPILKTSQAFRRQVAINEIQDLVDLRVFGVGDEIKTMRFTAHVDTLNRIVLNGSHDDRFVSVDVVTLDSQLTTDRYYFFKIDIEGYEYAALKGATKLLNEGCVLGLIVEVNSNGSEYGYDDNSIHSLLTELGFFLIDYEPVSRQIQAINRHNSASSNSIYVKDIEYFRARCLQAPAYTIHSVNSRI